MPVILALRGRRHDDGPEGRRGGDLLNGLARNLIDALIGRHDSIGEQGRRAALTVPVHQSAGLRQSEAFEWTRSLWCLGHPEGSEAGLMRLEVSGRERRFSWLVDLW